MAKASTRQGRLAGVRIAARYIDQRIAAAGPDAAYAPQNRDAIGKYFARLKRVIGTDPQLRFHRDH